MPRSASPARRATSNPRPSGSSARLERQILPDGGHVSRDPGAIIELLLELLPLRQAFAARNIAPPPALLNAIDRMMPMLRFFRHSDGTFAHFNGMGATPAELLLTLLAYDETRGAPLSNAPYSGYQRLEAGGGVADHGYRPRAADRNEPRRRMPAACRSNFLRRRQSLIVVNCGMPATAREEWRPLARATAAHSTVTFNDASSAEFVDTPAFRRVLGGSPMLGGPSHVTVSREERPDAIVLRAAHDGYADRFGVVHERTLMLAADGTRLEGEDLFLAADGGSQLRTGQDRFAVRFHLHPSIKATRLTDGHGVLLMMPNQEVWTFQRRRGSRGARRQRLSCRQRWPAPRRANRHQRPRAVGAARRLELPAGQRRRYGERRRRAPRPRRRTAAAAVMPRDFRFHLCPLNCGVFAEVGNIRLRWSEALLTA